jgi:pimeloyl-ACP methyl ester carboxylesterase
MRPQEECIYVQLPIVGPTSHYFYSQRLKLHYVDWGNPEKPLMVLVHGGRDHARNWDQSPCICGPRIISSRRLRGHGDSEWALGSEYSMISMCSDRPNS